MWNFVNILNEGAQNRNTYSSVAVLYCTAQSGTITDFPNFNWTKSGGILLTSSSSFLWCFDSSSPPKTISFIGLYSYNNHTIYFMVFDLEAYIDPITLFLKVFLLSCYKGSLKSQIVKCCIRVIFWGIILTVNEPYHLLWLEYISLKNLQAISFSNGREEGVYKIHVCTEKHMRWKCMRTDSKPDIHSGAWLIISFKLLCSTANSVIFQLEKSMNKLMSADDILGWIIGMLVH